MQSNLKHCTGRLELNEQGEPLAMIGTVLDITTRHELDKKLKSLGSIVENSHNEVYIFNAENFSFSYANKTVQNNLGYRIEEMEGMKLIDIVPSYTIQSLFELLEPLQNGSEEYLIFNALHRRKNGSEYTVAVFNSQKQMDTNSLW